MIFTCVHFMSCCDLTDSPGHGNMHNCLRNPDMLSDTNTSLHQSKKLWVFVWTTIGIFSKLLFPWEKMVHFWHLPQPPCWNQILHHRRICTKPMCKSLEIHFLWSWSALQFVLPMQQWKTTTMMKITSPRTMKKPQGGGRGEQLCYVVRSWQQGNFCKWDFCKTSTRLPLQCTRYHNSWRECKQTSQCYWVSSLCTAVTVGASAREAMQWGKCQASWHS